MDYKKSKAWCQPKHTCFVKRRCVGVQKWGPRDSQLHFHFGSLILGCPISLFKVWGTKFWQSWAFLMVGNVLKTITIKWDCILKSLTKICNTSYWNWKGWKSNCQNDSQSLNQCLLYIWKCFLLTSLLIYTHDYYFSLSLHNGLMMILN